jgi:hypothetical protein
MIPVWLAVAKTQKIQQVQALAGEKTKTNVD